MQIKYIGNHRPKGMVVDVSEDVAKDAIESGEFVEVGKEPEKLELVKTKVRRK